MARVSPDKSEMTGQPHPEGNVFHEHDTLKYSLLGPSLTKSGQDNVDQQKVSLLCLRVTADSNTC
jgi:DNA polymerase kappa